MIIVDTNVVSELMHEIPDRRVAVWMDHEVPDQVFTTAVTKAEIYYGIQIKMPGKKRSRLEAFADAIFGDTFKDRILPFDSNAAAHFAEVLARRKAEGRRMSEFDAQIAAITRAHSAVLATRSVRDFESCGIQLLNPWNAI